MRRILFVDDQQCELDGMVRMMDWAELGLEVAGAVTDPRAALEIIRNRPVDVVVTDVIMRDMDGLALVRELRRSHPEIRSVCISCFDDFRFVSAAVNESGVSGYMLKPIRVNEMRDLLKRILKEMDREQTAALNSGRVALMCMDAADWHAGLPPELLNRSVRVARGRSTIPGALARLALNGGEVIQILPASAAVPEGSVVSDAVPLRDARQAYLQIPVPAEPPVLQNEEDAIRTIKENVQHCLRENAGMQRLLENVYFSEGYANSLFKDATGMTIHQYLIQQRLKEAARLLMDEPDARIKDIAWRCGFADASHLINSFRKSYGCSPEKYRRRVLKP